MTQSGRIDVEPCDADTATRTVARYQALVRVSEAVKRGADRYSLFRSLARHLSHVVPFGVLGIALHDELRRATELHVLDATGELLTPPRLTPEETLASWVIQHQQPLIIPVVSNETRFPRAMECMRRQSMRSVCAVPFTTPGRRVGMLLAASREWHSYDFEDVTFLSLVASHVAPAIDDARSDSRLQKAPALEREGPRSPVRGMVATSPEWQAVLKVAAQVAATDTTVLLVGESGTGKEVVARFIHRASSREAGPLVALNCAALPEHLLESELFGYERGAFTGAQQAKPGQLERAAGGVLFLDEVSEMSASAQAKILRVLQEREFQRLGGTRTLKANVRVVAATNRDLKNAVQRGDFREDLYYRLQVFDIHLPPLRNRPTDILPLSEFFLQDLGRQFGRPPSGLTRDAAATLLQYHWPGNVRELRNALERAAILSEGGLITADHLSLNRERRGPLMPAEVEATTDLNTIENGIIARVLIECAGNKTKAAARLGLSRTQLYVRLRRRRPGNGLPARTAAAAAETRSS